MSNTRRPTATRIKGSLLFFALSAGNITMYNIMPSSDIPLFKSILTKGSISKVATIIAKIILWAFLSKPFSPVPIKKTWLAPSVTSAGA